MSKKRYLPARFHTWKNGVCVDCKATIEEVRAGAIKVPVSHSDVEAMFKTSDRKTKARG